MDSGGCGPRGGCQGRLRVERSGSRSLGVLGFWGFGV